MSEVSLKSYQFRREREASWVELEGQLRQLEKGSLRSLTPAQLLRLPTLYRAALSSLSVARAISLDQSLLAYLESLASRAYFQIYAPREGIAHVMVDFFEHRFPMAVRSLWRHVALSALLFFVGAYAGYELMLADSEWFYTLMPEDMVQDRSPKSSTESLRSTLYDRDSVDSANDLLTLFASFLFVHNAKIGMMCFALGIALGLPTAVLILTNGVMLGVFVGLFASRGLGIEVMGWLSIHGTTEILAVILCGGAGFALGDAILFPDRGTRLSNLARRGRVAGMVVMGAVCMLLIAGLLEGIGRQVIRDDLTRYLIGYGMLGLWLLYFWKAGDKAPRSDV